MHISIINPKILYFALTNKNDPAKFRECLRVLLFLFKCILEKFLCKLEKGKKTV